MREHQKNRRAAVRGRTKRYLVAAIAIVLTLALSATALADSGRGNPPGGQGGPKTQQPNGDDAQNSATPSADRANGKDGNHTGKMEGLNVEKIEEAIAALTDETAKASLTTLLSAYVDAWTTKQEAVESKDTDALAALTDAMTAAKTALDTALETAGIATDTIYGVPEEAKDGTGRMSNRPTLDTDEIAAAIAALDDSNESKATLTSLLAAYEDALAAQTAADTTTLSEEELQALATAVDTAEEALLAASREAELIGGLGRGQFVNGNAYGNAELDVETIANRIAALDDTDANKAALSDLLTAYEAALTAETASGETTLTETELDALHDATKTAANALKSALENAGIEAPQMQLEEEQTHAFRFSVVDAQDANNSETAGGLTAFLDWLKSLFD
jgi:hypothetical protein